MADEVINEGKSMMKDDDLIFLGDQETYHTWRFVSHPYSLVLTETPADISLLSHCRWAPLSTEDGTVKGLMINSFETTKNVLRQRWLTCLRDLSARISS
jgi:hypothetical protein